MPLISGGTTGTPISPGTPIITPGKRRNCVLSLSDYARIIHYDECAFWGVSREGQEDNLCRLFWTEYERMAVDQAIADAQMMLEDELNYPLCPTWIVGDTDGASVDNRLIDQQSRTAGPYLTRWGMVIAGGIMAQTAIATGVQIDYSSDPAIVVVFGVDFDDPAEVVITYPGSDRQIQPSAIQIDSGILTVHIPRCRMVQEELLQTTTRDWGVSYTDLDNFLETVDVWRVYNDDTRQAVLVGNGNCSDPPCEVVTQDACITVRNNKAGIVQIKPTVACGSQYTSVQLNYLAGLRNAGPPVQNVLFRLANALMPNEPCGCEAAQLYWKRDRDTPEILTRERLNCPFGQNAGGWFAYQWTLRNKLVRSRVYG